MIFNKHITKALLVGSLFVFMLLLSGCNTTTDSTLSDKPVPNGKMKASITRVVDGDTFEISTGEKVRLIGVDTPETVKPNHPVEAYGKEASDYTKKMLTSKQVTLQFDVEPYDKYGRLLAYVYLEDGTFYNEHVIKEGYARIMTVPPNVAQADLFLKGEQEARKGNIGLWGAETKKPTNSNNKPESNGASEQAKGKIKGNINSKGKKIYHMPGGRNYEETNPEVWFETEEEAVKAGFRKAEK
ncbi:thermonuclease family protein [Brevibacillus daliensis]|uniref:thermonuclease family protein n=1 Tax=Brevibacillus daliensis TaxID=2892995 RepID=UPI001E3B8D31|nr:thermonuclease family protein [Brevibacillus daliensis]